MKKILKLISKAAILILILALSGCYYDEIVEEFVPDIPDDVVVSYELDVQPIFTASCASCHPTIADPDLTAGSSYSSIINGGYIVPEDPDASILYQTLITTNAQELMPPSAALPASDIKIIETWIKQGAEDN
jgi:hypothetical protein